MTKEELAEQYANEKAAEFTQAIKEAYLKGYELGELHTASTINVDGVKYYDLGLPSGTLWSEPLRSYGYRFLTYIEAEKLNIPTVEQFEELMKYTRRVDYPKSFDREVEIVGVSGGRISVCTKDYNDQNRYQGEKTRSDEAWFWLKSEADGSDAGVARITKYGSLLTGSHFKGYKLPVFLVKNKTEL